MGEVVKCKTTIKSYIYELFKATYKGIYGTVFDAVESPHYLASSSQEFKIGVYLPHSVHKKL